MTDEPRFRDLADGEMFYFFKGGSLLTKTGGRSYAAPQWGHKHLTADPEQEVIRHAVLSADRSQE